MPIAKNPNGARTDAERRAQNKWDQANRVTLGVRVGKADGEAFRAWCAARGITVNAALSAYVADCLREGADALTLPADVAHLARHAAKLAGTAPATWKLRRQPSPTHSSASKPHYLRLKNSSLNRRLPEILGTYRLNRQGRKLRETDGLNRDAGKLRG